MITYEDFKKVEIKLGKILSVEVVPDADKLLKLMVDMGEENPRQIVSGIRKHFEYPESLVGRKCFFVSNLEPRTIKGLQSNGMLFAIGGDGENPFSLIYADDSISQGKVAC